MKKNIDIIIYIYCYERTVVCHKLEASNYFI